MICLGGGCGAGGRRLEEAETDVSRCVQMRAHAHMYSYPLYLSPSIPLSSLMSPETPRGDKKMVGGWTDTSSMPSRFLVVRSEAQKVLRSRQTSKVTVYIKH